MQILLDRLKEIHNLKVSLVSALELRYKAMKRVHSTKTAWVQNFTLDQ